MSWNLARAVSVAPIRQNSILFVRRQKQPFLGKWSLPGGRIEKGETIQQAMRREVEEETGHLLRQRISGLVALNSDLQVVAGQDIHKCFLITSAWNTQGMGKPKQKLQMKWMTLEQMDILSEDAFTPKLKQILKILLNTIR